MRQAITSKVSITTLLVATLSIAACSGEVTEPADVPATAERQFIGSEQCATCHEPEFERWLESHHQLAMQAANSDTVLGDFSAEPIPYFDTETVFFRRDGRYYVNTQNSLGVNEEFEITHTFGVTPLQQYLVDAPGGRKQALQFAWDSRATSAGGQRWFHLYAEDEITAGDPLHWTGNYFNWNYMCAECHSTDVQLGYDADKDSFDTTFAEVSVGCESCHGPGSRHVAQANDGAFDQAHGLPVDLDDHDGATWIMDPSTGIANRSRPNSSAQQAESCGRCHARRTVLTSDYEYGTALTDTHMPALLEENLYYADGRIQDEVYVYGSFIQSKMHAAGVTCTDCHDPHSGELHAGPNPNDTCAQCHLPARFASVDHNPAAVGDCVSCHMPATTYMGVDDRRDHSFRLPNAGLSASHYAAAIEAGRNGGANQQLLAGIANSNYPPVARATMLTLMEPAQDPSLVTMLNEQLRHSDPLIRIAALRSLRSQSPEWRMQFGSSLLRDPIRGVRIEAAITYADYRDLLPLEDARAYSAAVSEYRDALQQAEHMPETALQLADFEARSGNLDEAERLFKRAVTLDAEFAPAQHAYGLFLVRSNRHDEALGALSAAATYAPDTERFVYVYGVALNSLGQSAQAVEVLADARTRFPDSFDIAWALATMLRDRNDTDAAKQLAENMALQFPENEQVNLLLDSLPK